MKINDNEVAKRLKDAKQQLVKTLSLKPLLNRATRLHSGNPYSHYQNPEFGIIGLLEYTEFSPRRDAEYIQSIKVLSLGNEFRKVMAVRVNQEKFGEGIA